MNSGYVLNIVNTPNTFTMNLQDENFHHNDFFITAATPAAGNTFILDIGSNAGTIGVLGATGGTPNDIEDTWTVTGYSTVNIHLAGSDDVHLASSGGFVANSGGFGATTINISGSLVDGTDVQEMHFGNVSGVTIDEFFSIGSLISSPDEARGVTTFDGTINDTAKVFLELGATDAVIINAASGHGLDMEQPDTSADDTITVTGSTNNFNNLQGSLALVRWLYQQQRRLVRTCRQGDHHRGGRRRPYLGYWRQGNRKRQQRPHQSLRRPVPVEQ